MAHIVHPHTANDSVFYEFHDLAISLEEDTLTWFALDSVQLARMWELAESNFDIAIHAQAVLGLVLDTIFERTPEPLPSGPSFKAGNEETQDPPVVGVLATTDIKVFPNPFQNSFRVDYMLDSDARQLRVEVCDLMGRRVYDATMGDVRQGTLNIDLGQCLGIYLLRIEADSRRIHQQKVVCVQY